MAEKMDRNSFLAQLKDILEKGNFNVSMQETKTLSSGCISIMISQILIIIGTFLGLSRFGFLGAALILIGTWNITKILNGELPFLHQLFPGRNERFIFARKETRNDPSSTNLVLIFNLNPDITLESPGTVTRYGLFYVFINALLIALIFTGTYLKLQGNYKLTVCLFLIFNVFALSYHLTEHGKTQINQKELAHFEQNFFKNLLQSLKNSTDRSNLFFIILTNDTYSAQTRKIFESYNFDRKTTLILSLFETLELEVYLLRQEGILFRYNHDRSGIDFMERALANLGKTRKPPETAKVIHNTYYLSKKGFTALPLYVPVSESLPQFLSKLIDEINKLRSK